jgi:hypothetical protein
LEGALSRYAVELKFFIPWFSACRLRRGGGG